MSSIFIYSLWEICTLNLTLCFFCISRPHSTDSATHRKMTLSLADRCSKTQKIRILPMAGRDPESHRNEMIKVTRSHTLSICACSACLSSALFEKDFVATGTKICGTRPVVDKHHDRLHKDITWRAYIIGLHSGQWNGNSVSVSGGGLIMYLLSTQTSTADSRIYSFTVPGAQQGQYDCTGFRLLRFSNLETQLWCSIFCLYLHAL